MIINKNVFNITNISEQYFFTGTEIIITDYRLKFINEAIVFNTQTQTQYKRHEMNLDPISGVLNIISLELNDYEHLTITLI